MHAKLFVASLLASAIAVPAIAQVPTGNTAPQPVPFVDTIPVAVDAPYPGTIKLDVDATDTERGIFRVKETIPVTKSGPMALLYPKWLPGNHAPRGEIEKLAGLVIRANGKVLPWTRDTVDVYAFHIDVPAGAKSLDVEFQFISATQGNQGRIVATPNLISLQPNSVSLYPAGYFTRQIPIQMTARFPTGWTAAGAVPANANGSTYAYQTTNYEILVDSPVLAGRYGKTWPLSPRVNLNVFADSPELLAATPEQIDAHKRLVDQAVKTFGAQHYDHYEFLVSLSDQLGGIGLEHHRSSEDGTAKTYFTEWDSNVAARNLLPHEFTHSWDGKFRRGAELWTPDFRTPMRDQSLWVYEGQTQFWGYVFQARSGLVPKADTLEAYANIMATLDNRPAREWRPLIDTTQDPIIVARSPKGWLSQQRSEDYYNEGLLVWMEVDSILREKSGGTKSIDDFARAFFGLRDGDWGVVTYRFDDVVATLNGIQPYDWRGLLMQRLNGVGPRAPLGGFERNGYKLVYTDQPNKAVRKETIDLSYSLGLMLGKSGITGVTWNSPAYKAGMSLNDEIVAVNGQAFSNDVLVDAVKAAKGTKAPIKLLLKSDDRLREVAIDYHEGLRYPHLVKTVEGEAGLDKLLQPR